MTPIIQNDADGVPRHLSFPHGAPVQDLAWLSPQAQANGFLYTSGSLLALPAAALKSLDRPPASWWPEPELNELRTETQTRVTDSHVIGYAQTYFGLPVIGAGVTVTLRDNPRAVLSATSTIHHEIQVARPSDEALKHAMTIFTRRLGVTTRLADIGLAAPSDGFDERQRDMRINAARLVVFRYEAAKRSGQAHPQPPPPREPDDLRDERLPSLPLPRLPETIRDSAFYVAVEVNFTLTASPWGRLTWVMYIDVATLGVLQLKPRVDPATAGVFLRDPVGVEPPAQE